MLSKSFGLMNLSFKRTCSMVSRVSRPGDKAPMFTADAVVGTKISKLSLSDYAGKWVYLFFYPKDFTYVCPTEIIAFSERHEEFASKNCQIIGASVDSAEVHLAWIKTPRANGGLGGISYPLVSDLTKNIADQFNVLNKSIGISYRGSYLIDPSGIVQQITMNNFPVGRSVDEALRLIDAFQFVDKHGEVCPADFKAGSSQSMKANPDDSKAYFKQHFDSLTPSSPSTSQIKTISSSSELESLLSSNKKVVIEYHASWCTSCHKISPHVEELAHQYKNDIVFAKIDTSEHSELSDVDSLPTFKFYVNGKPFSDPVIGANKQKLASAISQLL